ncbi:hypothetical protein CP533_3225 [Ophiocordyceps camponoti-saundersi (nom. inval.)]|nr:hypothetical protein CP533_3225 [Ophiocordyceps camponoti-saundersi (nom. inval.)]
MITKEDLLKALRKDLSLEMESLDEMGTVNQLLLEQRLLTARVDKHLSRAFAAAIYSTWLQERVYREGGKLAPAVLDTYLQFLVGISCDKEMITRAWLQAALNNLEKWFKVMEPDVARDVRIGVKTEIVNRFSTGDYMKVDYRGLMAGGIPGIESQPSIGVAGNSAAEKADDCQVCGSKNHSSDKCPGKNFGYGPRSSIDPALAHERMQNLFQNAVPKRENRSAGFTRQNVYQDQQGISRQAVSSSCMEDNRAKHGKGQLKPWKDMNDVERKALIEADAFLDSLAEELTIKNAAAARNPAPVSESTGSGSQTSNTEGRPNKKRDRIPVLGELVEPTKPKAKLSPVDEDATMTGGGPPLPNQQVTLPTRPAGEVGQSSTENSFIRELFSKHENVIRNPKVKRKTALEMWDEHDAKLAAEEAESAVEKAESAAEKVKKVIEEAKRVLEKQGKGKRN